MKLAEFNNRLHAQTKWFLDNQHLSPKNQLTMGPLPSKQLLKVGGGSAVGTGVGGTLGYKGMDHFVAKIDARRLEKGKNEMVPAIRKTLKAAGAVVGGWLGGTAGSRTVIHFLK